MVNVHIKDTVSKAKEFQNALVEAQDIQLLGRRTLQERYRQYKV